MHIELTPISDACSLSCSRCNKSISKFANKSKQLCSACLQYYQRRAKGTPERPKWTKEDKANYIKKWSEEKRRKNGVKPKKLLTPAEKLAKAEERKIYYRDYQRKKAQEKFQARVSSGDFHRVPYKYLTAEQLAERTQRTKKRERQRNRSAYLARNHRRRTRINHIETLGIPAEMITPFYDEAKRLTETTGIQHEVDHIVPLIHEKVCGLNVPWNLQILNKKENRKKQNKFDGTNENLGWKNVL